MVHFEVVMMMLVLWNQRKKSLRKPLYKKLYVEDVMNGVCEEKEKV
jgi:hypothetical protein